MKALSIKQPWAEMIRRGLKKIEVRSWQTAYRGDLLICSSAKPDNWLTMLPNVIHPTRGVWCDASDPGDSDFEYFYKFGQALFIAELHDIKPMTVEHEMDACCDYSPGYYSWMLRNIRPIQPFPVKGQLKIFEVNYHE